MQKIQSYLPVFPGFYGTHFEPEYDHMIDEGKTSDDYEWDNKGYEIAMSKAAVYMIEQKFIEWGFNLSVKFDNLYSPKFYNFSNDSINVTYSLKAGCIKAIKDYLKQNASGFEKYLRDNFTSCSGFISFYSNDVKDWNPITAKWLQSDSVYLGAILEFIAQNEQYFSYELYSDVMDWNPVYIEGDLINRAFTINGVIFTGNESDLHDSYLLNPYIDGVWESVTFFEWLLVNTETVQIKPEKIPNQLTLF